MLKAIAKLRVPSYDGTDPAILRDAQFRSYTSCRRNWQKKVTANGRLPVKPGRDSATETIPPHIITAKSKAWFNEWGKGEKSEVKAHK